MFSHSEQQLQDILKQNQISDDVIQCIVGDIKQSSFEKQIPVYIDKNEVRPFVHESKSYQITPLLFAVMADQVKYSHISDLFELPQLLSYAQNLQTATILHPIQYKATPALFELSTEAHGLCLDDININRNAFSVEDFLPGQLGNVYKDAQIFDFSNNPLLKLSQIREFLAQNSFTPKQIRAVNVQLDCELENEIVVDLEELDDVYTLDFTYAQKDFVYNNCIQLFIKQDQLDQLQIKFFPALRDLKVSFSTEFVLQEEILSQITIINDQKLTGSIIFIINDEIKLDYAALQAVKTTFNNQISKAKILLSNPIDRKITQTGQISLTNTKNNAAFAFFAGLLTNHATLTSKLHSNAIQIYHSHDNNIYQIIVLTKEIQANEPIYLHQQYWADQLATENAILNLTFCGQKAALPEFHQFDNSSIFNLIRNLNFHSMKNNQPVIGWFEPMPISTTLLALQKCEQFISEEFTLHSKFEAIQLFLAGQFTNFAPFRKEFNVSIQINQGVVQQFQFEFNNEIQPEFSVFEGNCTEFVQQIVNQFQCENMTILCDKSYTQYSILKII